MVNEVSGHAERNVTTFLLVMLASLTAFAPFVTDMYLPAFPLMQDFFDASKSEVQLGLTTSMVGLAIGHLIIGPLSDKFGRKVPLLASLACFAVASAFCIMSTNIVMFVALRFLQGFGASGGVVLARSIATDLYSGSPLARVMAIIGAISGIAPVLSPVIGGVLLSFSPWQGIFAVLLAIGIVLLVSSFRLPESHPIEKRRDMSVLKSFAQIVPLMKNRDFRLYTLMRAFCMFAFFGNISASPFIFQQVYGFSALAFSLIFGVNALTIGACAMLSVRFKTPQMSIRAGTSIFLFSSVCVAVSLYCHAPFAVFEASVWLMHAGFGLILAPMIALAMNAGRANAGLASAVFGAAEFVAGGISSPIVGQGSIFVTPGIILVSGAVLTFATAAFVRYGDRRLDKKALCCCHAHENV